MPIRGYGEDGLTLLALQQGLNTILQELRDDSAANECTAFYRPSFGRGGDASFGEFDVILVSASDIYLIESKWDGLENTRRTVVRLKARQTRRHLIFAWYLHNWNPDYAEQWALFMRERGQAFQETFPEKRLPGPRTNLAKHLECTLGMLHDSFNQAPAGVPTPHNVLLHFYRARHSVEIHNVEQARIVGHNQLDFDIVNFDYQEFLSPSPFVDLR